MIHTGYEISDFLFHEQQCARFPKTICRMCGVQIAGMIFQTRSNAASCKYLSRTT
ncbi:MAG: DUF6783 domain-containing protein [Blautia faecis]